MTKIPVLKLIEQFQIMAREKWSYVWGAASKGIVDCSGAFVYAYSVFTMKIPHGSNAIARKHCGQMMPISAAEPGMVAFKAHPPEEDGWDLPETYNRDPDRNDYYHMGLVGPDKKTVLNAASTSQGFITSKLDNTWDYVAYLDDVDYGDQKEVVEAIPLKTAIVVAPSGTTVNMRKEANLKSGLVDRVAVGTEVLVMQDKGEWMEILKGSKQGWMMSNYLEYTDLPDDTSPVIGGAALDQVMNVHDDLLDLKADLKNIIDKVASLAGIAG